METAFAKSVICDLGKLEEIRKEYEDTDDGRLLKGLGKEEAIAFFAINIYIYKWRLKVYEGVKSIVSDLYEEVQEHAGEVHCFVKIRGTAFNISEYIEDILQDRGPRWTMQAVNNAKSITELKDKEGGIKGAAIIVLNTGWGS